MVSSVTFPDITQRVWVQSKLKENVQYKSARKTWNILMCELMLGDNIAFVVCNRQDT